MATPLLRHRTGAQFHLTLSFRLVLIFVMLVSMVVALIGLITVTMLQRFLVQNLDEDLRSSGRLLATQTVNNIAEGRDSFSPQYANGSTDDINLSDYFIGWKVTTLRPLTQTPEPSSSMRINHNTEELHGMPADATTLLTSLQDSNPTTVAGTEGEPWRAMVIPVVITDTKARVGSILVARPLGGIITTVSHVTRLLIFVSLSIVLAGAIATSLLVRRSLKPLRDIEDATHKIAAGDLSQRVPRENAGTEVAMLADSINAMLAQIEYAFSVRIQSEKRMRQFVSDASHELRTPLATVRGYAELYRLGGVPTDELPATMNRVESEAKRMSGLVEDLLQLARLDEGRPLSLATMNLTEVCRGAVSDFHARNNSRNAELISLDGGEPTEIAIVADKDKVTQVVSNLLSNVLTHTPEGTECEVAVGVIGPDPLDESTESTEPRFAVVEIRDHGPGVKPADAEHLFERFYRTDSSRTRASGGSGLGMAIVAAIMGSHGGTARVRETDGGGLTVQLMFPLAG